MKLALWQPAPHAGDWQDLLQNLAASLAAAQAQGAGLLLCPELFVSGYNDDATILARAEPCDGPLGAEISGLAARFGLAVVYGYPERPVPGGPIYNAARLVGPAGKALLNCRKTHLYGARERALFTPGERLGGTAVLGEWRIGMLICFDIEFPEAARSLALAGANLLLVPTALPAGGEVVPNYLVPARAAENGIYVAYADYSGQENGLTYAGLSCIMGPDGGTIGRLGEAPGLLFGVIDTEAVRRTRLEIDYLRERRPTLYM
jgi:nitrilase